MSAERRIKIILDQTEAEAKARSLNNQLALAGKSADDLNKNLAKTKTEGDRAASGLDKVDKSGKQLVTTLTRVASAVSLALVSRQILEYADAFTNVQNQLRQTVSSQEELNEKFDEISLIAVRSRASLEGTAKLYTRFRLSVDEATFSNERLLRVTETINKGLALSGATATESAGALLQLSQAVASGVLRGQEFNSVSEQAPIVLKAIAAETGKTIGELREFAKTGGITADLLIKSLEKYGDTVDRVFAKSNATFGQSLEVARTNAIRFVGASEAIGSAVTAAGQSIIFLSENLNAIQNIVLGLTVLFGSRFVGALFASTTAIIANTRQAVVSKVTYDALGVAITRTTATMGAATVAANGLRAAMAFLGGPAGVIFLAASALVYFATQTDTAKQKSEELKGEIDLLISKYNELNETGKKIEFQKLETEASNIREQRKLIEEQIKAQQQVVSSRPASGGGLGGIRESADLARLQAQASEYDEQLTNIAKKQSALFESNLPTINTSIDTETKSFDDREAELAKVLEVQQKIADAERRLTAAEKEERDKRQKLYEANEAKLNALFEKQQERSRRITDGLVSENALIQQSLEQRAFIYETYGGIIYDIYAEPFQKQRALLEQSLIEQENASYLSLQKELAAIAERRQRLVEEDYLTDTARKEANQLLTEQEALLRQQHQQRLTEIDAQGKAARENLAVTEYQTRMAQAAQLFDAIGNLAQGRSKKLFKINKALALAQAAVALPTSVIETYKNNGGYPYGIIPAGIMLATGLANIAKINSTTFGGGSGGGAVVSGGGGTSAGPVPQLPKAPEQVQSVEDLSRDDLVRELKELTSNNQQIPARVMLQYLASEQAAKRIGP